MSLLRGLETMRLVKVAPSLRERLGQWNGRFYQRITVARLVCLRQRLVRDTEPEPWTALEAPVVLLLSDVCEALGLGEEERAVVLGPQGQQALAELLEARSAVPFEINDRQVKALAHVRERGVINLNAYRRICPHWSDETLRLDLAGLVAQGLLIKNGANKGTYYTLAP
ncbi:hypothetical protein GF345_06875 [Candidatus Woesearchaeota archaeon]|nr:hypothetical protein [Candidatus Woesearchaeota archaeon]